MSVAVVYMEYISIHAIDLNIGSYMYLILNDVYIYVYCYNINIQYTST